MLGGCAVSGACRRSRWPAFCLRHGPGNGGWVLWFRIYGYGLSFKVLERFWRRRYSVRRWVSVKVLKP